MNIHVEIFVWTYAFISFGVELMDHIFRDMFNFLKNCQTVSKVLVPFYIPSVGEFQFFHIPANTWYA